MGFQSVTSRPKLTPKIAHWAEKQINSRFYQGFNASNSVIEHLQMESIPGEATFI